MVDEDRHEHLPGYERDYALLYRVGRVFLGSYADQEALIEDQIQETFVRAWQKRSSLQKHPNPDGWLVECFRNCLMNACKKQSRVWKHHAFSAVAENVQPIADQMYLSPDDYVRTNEHVELLRRLLGEKDAEIFLHCCRTEHQRSGIADADFQDEKEDPFQPRAIFLSGGVVPAELAIHGVRIAAIPGAALTGCMEIAPWPRYLKICLIR